MSSAFENKGLDELKRVTSDLEKRFDIIRGRL